MRPLFSPTGSHDKGSQRSFSNDRRHWLSTNRMRVMLLGAVVLFVMSTLLMCVVLQPQAHKYLLPGVKERPRDKHNYALPTDKQLETDVTIVLTHGELGGFTNFLYTYRNLYDHTPRGVRVLVCTHRVLIPVREWMTFLELVKSKSNRAGKLALADVPLPFLHHNAARNYCIRGVQTSYGVFVTNEVAVHSPQWLHMLHARMTATGAPAISVALGPPPVTTTEEPSLGPVVKGGKGFVRVAQVLEGGLQPTGESVAIPWSSGHAVAVRHDVLHTRALGRSLFEADVPSRWEMLDLYLSIQNASDSEPFGVSGEDVITFANPPPLLVRDLMFIALRSVSETHSEVASRLRTRWQLPFSVDCWERLRMDSILQGLSFHNQSFPFEPYTHAGLMVSLLVLAGNNRFRVSSMHSEGPESDEVEHVFHGNATSTIKYLHTLYQPKPVSQQQQQQRWQQPESSNRVLSLSILNPHQVREGTHPSSGSRPIHRLRNHAQRRQALALPGGGPNKGPQGEGLVNGTSENWAKARSFAEGLILKGQAMSQKRCAGRGGLYPDFMFVRCLTAANEHDSLRQRLHSAASMVIHRPVAGQLDYWLWVRDGSAAAVLKAYEEGRSRWTAYGQKADLNCYQPHEHDAVDLPVSFEGQNAKRASKLLSWSYRPLTGEDFIQLWTSIAQGKD